MKISKIKVKNKSTNYQILIGKIQNKFPDICIGVDLIVGFPGETESDFLSTYNFIKNLNISYLHVFADL